MSATEKHNFVTQILAEIVDIVDDLIEFGTIVSSPRLLPPLAQHRGLLQLLLKKFVGLLYGVTQVGDAGEQITVFAGSVGSTWLW